jgi:hypothetical protein
MSAAASAGSASLTLVHEDIGGQVKIIGEAAEQMGRLVAFGPSAIVGALSAKALVVAPAVGAAAAAESAFEDDTIAFFDMMNCRGVLAEFFDAAENFMAEDDRIIDFELAVQIFDVRAAHAAHFYLNQPAIGGNVRHRIFADLEFVRAK